MMAAAAAGADIVDAAIDGMSGMTSQPSLGAMVANLRNSDMDTGIDLEDIHPLNTYWENVRSMYAPFESGQLSGSSDIVTTEIPGGQYTNMLFQSKQLGLGDKWPEVKRKYAEANMILGDIPKVTPSSKVVGDLAQFMVAQDLDADKIMAQADTLAFPDSVLDYLQGGLGVPPGGFPEPLRTKVLESRGLSPIEGRPGAFMDDWDLAEESKLLKEKYGPNAVSDKDLLSYAMYPKVFEDWMDFSKLYGPVTKLPTGAFLNPMKVGEMVEIELAVGQTIDVELSSIRDVEADGTRVVVFEVNGESIYMPVTDHNAAGSQAVREKAGAAGTVGAPMPGVIVGVQVKAGDKITEGDAVATMSAMKMESSIPATATGIVKRVLVNVGDKVEGDDLLVEIE